MKTNAIWLWEIVLFALLGAFMFASKQVMEPFPNVHMLGMLTVLYTLLFRVKALIPIYIFILLEGILCGFNVWWVPYLYLWPILFGLAMLIPRNKNPFLVSGLCAVVCSLHGFLYGTLYAPYQALMFNLTFKGTVAWIIAGIPFDIVHGISNFFMGLLVYPLYVPMRRVIGKFQNLK
ncbi:MAG: hypothetical protein IKZ59_01980 [Clostridia bacterium]|nr:hypothetical protein [Clostridia bacterium]